MKSLNKTEQVKVLVKVKKPKRFKAGAEWTTAVNLEVEEEAIGETESLQIQLKIEQVPNSEDPCEN